MSERPEVEGTPRASPRETWAALAREVGEAEAARRCAALLEATDPDDVADILLWLGGRAPRDLLDGRSWKPYWARVWGARGLLYVWDETCTLPVVAGLADESWRVAEMCVKVCARREIGSGGPGVAALAAHELPRVRAAVARTLGLIGDVEHEAVVRRLLDDPEQSVRATAERALARMTERLDLPAGNGR